MSFVVTGANKGIGFQIVKALLSHSSKPTVFLGSRSVERGEEARSSLGSDLAERCVVVELDVTDKKSVCHAARTIKQKLSESNTTLQGLVNNAGTAGLGFGWSARFCFFVLCHC